jgi:hypothetical protein
MAALGVLDGHLMVAQTWAWMSMMSERAPEQGVSAALESTFSGNAPCSMCCAIEKERQDKQGDAPIPETKPTVKFAPAMCGRGFSLISPAGSYVLRLRDIEILEPGRWDEPPLPPPQAS